MDSRVRALLMLALTACTTLDRAGGPLYAEKGELVTVRETSSRDDVALAWRELAASEVVFDVVPGDRALPSPLAIARASGHSTLQLRFPYDDGGIGAALLGGRTPLRADRATLEAIWMPGSGFAWLHPVARLKLEGPLSLHRWVEPIRPVAEDPAPHRDLIDDVVDRRFRYRMARGVERVTRLNFGRDVPSTWELAAIERGGSPVDDWQERARLALAKGRVDLVEDCVAVVRENAYGARRGKHYYALPLLHLLLASEVEGSSDRWSWSGLASITPARPNYDLPPLPGNLPAVSLRLVTLRDRTYRHGPSPLVHGLLSAAGYLGAWLIERGLGMSPTPDGWAEWWDDWKSGGRGKAAGRRNTRSP